MKNVIFVFAILIMSSPAFANVGDCNSIIQEVESNNYNIGLRDSSIFSMKSDIKDGISDQFRGQEVINIYQREIDERKDTLVILRELLVTKCFKK